MLAPLSWLYGLAIGIRHMLYNIHLLRIKEVNIPTICVGNLAVGGTGKTPQIEWLIRKLSPRYKVAVLSRGYRRRSCGFVLAATDSTARDIGDECMQLHRKFPHIPIAVCKNRVEGIEQLLKHCPDIQVVLLDDAYQYLRLRCGFYILLSTADCLYTDDHLIPYGRLRDFARQSNRANAVVITKCPDTMTPIDRRVMSNRLQLPAYQHLFFSSIRYQPLPKYKKALLLTGIARPEYLVQYIRQASPDGNDNLTHLAFSDHHRFKAADIQRITEAAVQVDYVFTTEKDYARLLADQLPDELMKKLYPIEISIQLTDEQLLLEKINHYLHKCIS